MTLVYDGRRRNMSLEMDFPADRSMSQDPLESNHCAEMLKALSDPIRLRIVDALRGGPKNVSDISEMLSVEMVTVSHHLGILHSAGLVDREKQGRYKVYRLGKGVFAKAASRHGKQHLDLGCCRLEIPKT